MVQTTTPQELNTLANRAMNGDEDAFNQLFETFFSIALGYSYKLPEYIREEFISDMCERLVACFNDKKWQDTGKPFQYWVHATAHNTACEWWRKHKKRFTEIQDPEFQYEEVEDNDISILEKILQQEEQAFLWFLVTKLPKKIFAVVIYERYFHERSFAEISEKIGKTEVYCRKIHQRALESLRQLAHASGYYPEKENKSKKDSDS